LTDINHTASPVSIAPARGRLLLLFAPILVVLAGAAVLFATAMAYPAERGSLVAAAEILAGVAGLFAIVELYHQIRVRQAAQRGLQRAQERAGDLVESAMDPIITIDELQHIVTFNTAAEETFGWTRDQVIGKPVDMLMPERFRSRHREHIEQFAAVGTTSRRMGGQAVLAGLRASGEEFPIEASISQYHEGDEVRFTVILRDVTERTRAQERLAASEARMRGILDSAMDAIITVDGDQRVVLFNAAAEAMFGYRREEALGMPLETFLPDRFRSVHAEHVRQFGAGATPSRRMADARVVTGLRRDGEEFPIDAAISHLTDGDTRFFTVILRDVSARVRAIEALRRSKEELQELGAAAQETRELEKSRVARELHDELGQSLTMLRMDVAWCRANLGGDGAGIAAKLERMEALLKTTVAATRRIASDLRPLMLDDLGLVPALEWLVQNMSQRAGIACDFTIDDPGLVLPPAHSTAIFRIVQEALTNIAKHAGATRAEVAVRQHEESVRITIHDDGVGFATDDPRKPSSYGLLGLRERATLLRGTATIRSEPGAGTAIAIELPLPGPKPS